MTVRADSTGKMGSARAAGLGTTATPGLLTAPNVLGISHLTSSSRSVLVSLVSTGGERRGTVCRVQRTTTQTVLTTHTVHHVHYTPPQLQVLGLVVVKQGIFWLTVPDVRPVLRTTSLILGLSIVRNVHTSLLLHLLLDTVTGKKNSTEGKG